MRPSVYPPSPRLDSLLYALFSLPMVLALTACGDLGTSDGDTETDSSSDTDSTGTDSTDSTDTDTDSTDTGTDTGGPSDPDFSVSDSRFQVRNFWFSDEVSFSGGFWDGPPVVLSEEGERIGNCRLMRFTPSFCDPPCAAGQVCLDEQCVDQPELSPQGEVEWSWPEGTMTVAPSVAGNYYAIESNSSEGETSVGVGGVELAVEMVTTLELIGDWGAMLEVRAHGEDLELEWVPDPGPARVRLYMTDCVGSHGGIAAAEIECEGPDSGSLVLPASFLDELFEDGDWSHGECGSHTFERYRAVSGEGLASTRLETVSAISFFFHAGF